MEGYEDTFDELNRQVESNKHTEIDQEDDVEDELDMLEYSRDDEEPPQRQEVMQEGTYEVDQEGTYEVDQEGTCEDQEGTYEVDHEEEDDMEEETDDEEEEEDEYAAEQDELNASQEKTKSVKDKDRDAQGQGHVYENKFTKPVLKLGNTTVSVGEARLYGLLDKDGNVKLDKTAKEKTRSKAEAKEVFDSLSRKKEKQIKPEAEDEDAKECRFKPQRSKEANRAMKNPSCGYDFVTRLDERGGFMDRNTAGGGESNKAKSEAAKEDYEASLDKLQCPSCKKYQSFDEYIEKRRSCGQCKERYQKLNIVNMNSWKQRQQEAERRKKERLKKIEEDFYGDASFAPKLNRAGVKKKQPSLTERTALLMEKQKEEAKQARLEKEKKEQEDEERKKQQARAARLNRAAAKEREMKMLNAASKGGEKERPSSKQSKTVPAAGVAKKKKKSTYSKTSNNISDKFDMLLN